VVIGSVALLITTPDQGQQDHEVKSEIEFVAIAQ